MRQFLVAVAVVGAISCGGGDTTQPGKATINGTWIGTTSGQTLSMALVDNNGVVNGSGSLTGFGGPFAQTISGTFNAPTLTLTLTSGQHPPFTLTATLSGATLSGSLSGSGFNGDAITLQNTTTGAGVLVSVSIIATSATIIADNTAIFLADARDKFGNALPASVSWSSSAPAIAEVDATGTALGLAPGSTTITASAAYQGGSASATKTLTVTASPWLGTWNLTLVNGIPVPANTFLSTSFPARVVSRTLAIQSRKSGTWADSSFSTLWCNPPATSGPLCNGSGHASITWAAPGSSLTFTVTSGTVVGKSPSPRIFTLLADGTLTATVDGQREEYRKQ